MVLNAIVCGLIYQQYQYWKHLERQLQIEYPGLRHIITSIRVVPAHSHRIGVRLPGRTLPNASLYHREANGSWVHRSNNLPKMSVNRLVYQEGHHGILYTATDTGVFFWGRTPA